MGSTLLSSFKWKPISENCHMPLLWKNKVLRGPNLFSLGCFVFLFIQGSHTSTATQLWLLCWYFFHVELICVFRINNNITLTQKSELPIICTLLYSQLQPSGNKELLDKCESDNRITLLWNKCWAKQGISAKGVQLYFPSSTYPAIVLSCSSTLFYCLLIEKFLIQVLSEVMHMCSRVWSIVNLYNKVLIISNFWNTMLSRYLGIKLFLFTTSQKKLTDFRLNIISHPPRRDQAHFMHLFLPQVSIRSLFQHFWASINATSKGQKAHAPALVVPI